jgi:septal ring factor EnvC (AmiA/AmiB activator)
MDVEKERGEKRPSSSTTIAEMHMARAHQAAKARHENYLGHRQAHKARISELEQTHALHQQQVAHIMRAHSAKERDLQHQLQVVKGHIQRGQASASHAPTIAYPAAGAASTVAYSDAGSRSRTRGSPSPDVLKPFHKSHKSRSPSSHVRPGLPFA